METIRTFIAINLSSVIRSSIAEIQSTFKPLNLKISWVNPENIHLTLKFLGKIYFHQLEEIRDRLALSLKSIDWFQVSLGKLGVFPDWGRPKVFWIGIDDKTQDLYNLWLMVESQLEEVGFKKNVEMFSPHITLARIKSLNNKNQFKKNFLSWKPLPAESFDVTEVKLYKSQLTPKGSVYTVMGTFPFRKPVIHKKNPFS